MKRTYDDIRHLPHPVPRTHPPMSRHNRAAQFAPFAALSGFDAAVAEAARLTERRVELDEQEQNLLDHRFQTLLYHLDEQPIVTITYFEADTRKDGGAYHTVTGAVHAVTGDAVTVGDTIVPFGNIVGLILEKYEME